MLGVVFVHFHTPALLAQAVQSLEADAAGCGLDFELVVVDNGSTPEEKAELESWRADRRVRILDPGRNLGYAGGLNAGVALLPAAQVLLLMNPDVLVEPGCLAALLAQLEAGAAVAGPAFFWDAPGGFELPPTEGFHVGDELLRIAAARWGGAFAGWARRRWRRRAWRHFMAEESVESYDLSGAMMMVQAEIYRRLGGFDEGYALYFEETDFLQRLRLAGHSARFEPAAKAVHLYAQSTPRDGRAGELFAASRNRYRARFQGRRWARLLGLLERGVKPAAEPAAEPLEAEGSWELAAGARWLEISPSPLGFPAAARPLPEGAGAGRLEKVLSAALVARMAPGTYRLRVLSGEGRELAVGRLEIASSETKSG